MRTTALDRLVTSLTARRFSAETIRLICNDVFSPTIGRRSVLAAESTWDNLEHEVRAAIKAVATNRSKWPPQYKELYERYLALIREARDDIDNARNMLVRDPDTPDGPKVPAKVADITRLAAKRNAKTNTNGPTCTATWQTWIDPKARDDLINAFDAVFLDNKTKGNRPRPFMGGNIKSHTEAAITRLESFIERQRTVLTIPGLRHPTAPTPYAALHLAAIRMAERALDKWKAEYKRDPYIALTNQLPVNWMHLLEPEMRARIIAADKNPASVSPEGLSAFLTEADPFTPPDGQPDHDFDAEPTALMQPTPPADTPDTDGEYED